MLDMSALRRFLRLPTDGVRFDYEVTVDRVACLADVINEPTQYVQRLVEQLSFVPTGGQQWIRTLQIQIPDVASEPGRSWRIVPLGQFSRLRLADLTACDADGKRLNLLTRRQHGDALTDVVTTKYASELTLNARARLLDTAAGEPADALRFQLFQYLTNLDVPPETWTEDDSEPLFRMTKQYEKLLVAIGLSKQESEGQAKQFFKEFAKEAKTAPYLCWVKASPGEVVNLQVRYTATDPKHKLALGGLWDLGKAVAGGVWPIRSKAREIRAGWFRQYGLAPIDYGFDIPKKGTGSYYLTLEPPSNTFCTYLDWEVDDSFNKDKEVDSAFPAAHLHADEEDGSGEDQASASGKIRAYLRCAPHHHKQILGATALNVAVVWLLAKGELPVGFGEPLQALIAAAPSILIAFLAQQQRHYYANVMRRQRAILWTYLAFSVVFLVSVAFSAQSHSPHESGLPLVANVAAWVLAISSVGIFTWHLPLGGSYERVVKYLTDRKHEIIDPESYKEPGSVRALGRCWRQLWWRIWGVKFTTKWECYGDAVRQYSCVICISVLVSMGGAAFLLHEFADFSLKPDPKSSNQHATFVGLAGKPKLHVTSVPFPGYRLALHKNPLPKDFESLHPPAPTYPAPAGSPRESTGR